ncbi:MAG: carotenoid 1,2-hydratase [Ardenticatenia bacterium]|nr:carotenoid 1,2-hydratase [Ardenticatenia bacterium]
MTGRVAKTVLLVVVLGLGAWLTARALRPVAPALVGADVVGYLAGDAAAGFARVTSPLALAFPRDEGPHPTYQTEWWYYTGNLATAAEGRRFGFQLTFFRRALRPPSAAPTPNDSAWRADQVYLAHFALADVAGKRFRSAERLQRGALGLAGATADPFRVWVDDWSAQREGGSTERPITRLSARDGDMALDLRLEPQKGRVLHGEQGYSPKGPEPGNASMYLSFTRLGATGSISAGGRTLPVAGLAWMDHEWSTSALGARQTGWDWFSLQLDDGRDLMLFQLREHGGGVAASSSGSLIAADGRVRPLGRSDFDLTVTDRWTSPRSGARYPSGWRLAIPSASLDLVLEPQLADQELAVGLRYWEGTVRVTGRGADGPLTGYGYAELTGYAGPVGR